MIDDIITRIISVVARTQHLPPAAISPESTFEEIGIDSLSGLAIAAELEREFEVEIPNEQVLGLRDLPQVIAMMEALVLAGEARVEAANRG
jgi:acyl carrier protein